MFKTKERKIIIISLLSLGVAVVTFGVLGSTGTFKNSLYDLGGAIVGFVVIAVLLNKFYGVDPGEIPASERKGRAFLSEETVKILDMRNQTPISTEERLTVPKNRVILIDHYRLKENRRGGSDQVPVCYRGIWHGRFLYFASAAVVGQN